MTCLKAWWLDEQATNQAAERNDTGKDENYLIIKICHQPDSGKGTNRCAEGAAHAEISNSFTTSCGRNGLCNHCTQYSRSHTHHKAMYQTDA